VYIEKYFSEPLLNLQKELGGEQVFTVEGNADPRDQKSIQATSTFRPASTDPKIIWREISENAERACENAREINLVSNKISFFVKNSDFKYREDGVKLPLYTADPGVVLNAIEEKFLKLLVKKERIRSTGITLSNLVRVESVQLDLFGKQDKALKNLAIEEAADKIRKKYGESAIKRVASLKKRE
jgi:DNA polymerase-4